MQDFEEAMAAHRAGRLAVAERLYRKVLSADAGRFPVLFMFGILQAQQGSFLEAERLLRDALALNPNDAGAQFNYGNVLLCLERFDDAFAAFGVAVTLNPTLREAHLNRGNILMTQKRFAEAVACFDSALEIDPHYPEAHCNRANALIELRRYAEALVNCAKALAVSPKNAEFHASRANVLHKLHRHEEALNSLATALSLQPDNANFHYNRGNVLFELRRFAEAFEAFDCSFNLEPQAEYVEGDRFFSKMMICNWQEISKDAERLAVGVSEGRPVARPFAFLAAQSSQLLQTRCANLFSDREFPSIHPQWTGPKYRHDRIRVAYLSADFHEHPVSHLLVGMFESHDRARFETIGVTFGDATQTPLRRRLESSFERFLDVRNKSDSQIFDILREREVGIAIDLMGPTEGARPGIFAKRPAPVQVMYLGYAGSSGAAHIDYILADRIVVPEDEQELFREKVIYLPETFMGTDDRRPVAAATPPRHTEGLPPEGFVFCAFSNSYKISPQVFDVWMTLLRQVEKSVLWLSNTNETAKKNLQREARSRGVAPERLVFARRVERNEDHLARHRLADLFLDTFPLGAHSTVCDALWVGTPVLTCAGQTFGGRVAASLLSGLGATELIASSVSAYAQIAWRLADEPQTLAAIKVKVGSLRRGSPLFNTRRFTTHIEGAYTTIWDRYQRGESPSCLWIQPFVSM